MNENQAIATEVMTAMHKRGHHDAAEHYMYRARDYDRATLSRQLSLWRK